MILLYLSRTSAQNQKYTVLGANHAPDIRVRSIRHARYVRIKKDRSIQMYQKMYTEQFMYQFILLPK